MKRDLLSQAIGVAMRVTKAKYRNDLKRFLGRVEDRAQS